MRILLCVEFYYPSLGGAQEVVRQLAERFIKFGHEVHIATSKISGRELNHKGVQINEFEISGNLVRGFNGQQSEYKSFLIHQKFDVVMFYAAQQWTFDLALDLIDRISAKKVLVPCGYSGLYDSAYEKYFALLPSVLKKFDAVIYHAENYRDINFSKLHNLNNDTIIPNAADIKEFMAEKDLAFRESLGVDESTFIILTVGTVTGKKGHLELVQAYSQLDLKGKKSLLILNGNEPEQAGKKVNKINRILSLVKCYGIIYTFRHIGKHILLKKGFNVGSANDIWSLSQKVNREQSEFKKVIQVDLSRESLVQAYLNANLFVFASNIEYSPLVLFEACAAKLPFLTVPVGNTREIAKWTGGGEICDAPIDEEGCTRVEPDVLAKKIETLVQDKHKLKQFSESGFNMCQQKYNWDVIATEYEKVFINLAENN
jgi:glycosyltransferase involved in cell wall biosynthesis